MDKKKKQMKQIKGINVPLPRLKVLKPLPIISKNKKSSRKERLERLKLQRQLESIFKLENETKDRQKIRRIRKARMVHQCIVGDVSKTLPVKARKEGCFKFRGFKFGTTRLDVRYFVNQKPTKYGFFIELDNLLEARDMFNSTVDEMITDILPKKYPKIFED